MDEKPKPKYKKKRELPSIENEVIKSLYQTTNSG
jgi:hypothetical protein